MSKWVHPRSMSRTVFRPPLSVPKQQTGFGISWNLELINTDCVLSMYTMYERLKPSANSILGLSRLALSLEMPNPSLCRFSTLSTSQDPLWHDHRIVAAKVSSVGQGLMPSKFESLKRIENQIRFIWWSLGRDTFRDTHICSVSHVAPTPEVTAGQRYGYMYHPTPLPSHDRVLIKTLIGANRIKGITV